MRVLIQSCTVMLMCFILVGCGTAKHSVQEGIFQKRKFQSGWHIDLHGSKRKVHGETLPRDHKRRGDGSRNDPSSEMEPEPIAIREEAVASTATEPIPETDQASTGLKAIPRSPAHAAPNLKFPEALKTHAVTESTNEERPGNRPWSIPAILAPIAVVMIFLVAHTGMALLMFALALALMIIGFSGTSKKKRRGKGFAILALAMLAFISLAMILFLAGGGGVVR